MRHKFDVDTRLVCFLYFFGFNLTCQSYMNLLNINQSLHVLLLVCLVFYRFSFNLPKLYQPIEHQPKFAPAVVPMNL